MGVLNVTPDSFSGDGTLTGPDGIRRSVDQALRFEDEGADIIDVGGESTRPPSVYRGAQPVSAEIESERVLPVIDRLSTRLSVPMSIDTRKAIVAEQAVRAGASMINDVSMLGDAEMAVVASNLKVPIVISHTRPKAVYDDPVADVTADLRSAVDRAGNAGVGREMVIVDPGIGFGKKAGHSLAVLRRLDTIKRSLGLPVLIGTSRKSFIGAVLELPVEERFAGTAATVALSIAGGADIVRVHEVGAIALVARMSDAVVRGWQA
jgi:dihydropteroate synthase